MFKGIETFGDGAPKHIGIDIVVIVAKHAPQLAEFGEFHFRIFGVKAVAQFSRSFANPLQATLDRILRLAVGDELLCGDTLHVGADPRDVFKNIAQASGGIARKH